MNFSIVIGPYHGRSNNCGDEIHYMKTAGPTPVICSPVALGSTLKITLHTANTKLTLCEVVLFGNGKIYILSFYCSFIKLCSIY